MMLPVFVSWFLLGFRCSDLIVMTVVLMDFAGVLLNMLVNPPLPVYSLLVRVSCLMIDLRDIVSV